MLVTELQDHVAVYNNRHDKIDFGQLEELKCAALEAAKKGEEKVTKEILFRIIHGHPNRKPDENDMQCILREICEMVYAEFGVFASVDMSTLHGLASDNYKIDITISWEALNHG